MADPITTHVVADREKVREIFDVLAEAWDKITRDKEPKFVDAFMAIANFARYACEDIERAMEADFNHKHALRTSLVNTIRNGLIGRLIKEPGGPSA